MVWTGGSRGRSLGVSSCMGGRGDAWVMHDGCETRITLAQFLKDKAICQPAGYYLGAGSWEVIGHQSLGCDD